METGKWTISDFIVITTYWSPEILHCFLQPWVQKHAEIYSGDTYHSHIALHDSIVFFTQYVLALLIALHVDLKNHKLQISAGAMLVYFTIPLFGIFLINWPAAQLMLMRCGLAVHVVVKAVRFSAIFEQPPGPNGDNTRLTTAVNETLSVVGCTVYFVLRHDPRGLSYIPYMLIWCGLSVAILAVLVSHFVIRTMVRTRDIEEDSVGKIIEGIKLDPRGAQYKYIPAQRAHSALGLGLFLAIVFLFSTVNVTEVIINKLEIREMAVSRTDMLIASVLHLCVVPLVALLFVIFKRKRGIISGGLLLSFAYFCNIVSLFSSIVFLDSSKPIVGVIDQPENCTVDSSFLDPTATGLFFDIAEDVPPVRVDVENRSLLITESSPYFRPHISFQINDTTTLNMVWSIEDTGEIIDEFPIEAAPRTQYYYLFHKTASTGNIQIEQYDSSKFILTKQEDVDFRMFLHVNVSTGEENPTELSVSSQGNVLKTLSYLQLMIGYAYFSVPRYPTYTISCVRCACGETQRFDYSIHKSISRIFVYFIEEVRFKDPLEKKQPYCYPLHSYFIISGANCTEEPTTPKPKVEDKFEDQERNPTLVICSLLFKSLAVTSALVSFINFYWSESPNRLRTTTLAAAFAVNDALVALTVQVFPDLSIETALFFIFLNFSVGLVHVPLFIFYLFYYTKEGIDLDLRNVVEIPIDTAITLSDLDDNDIDDSELSEDDPEEPSQSRQTDSQN